MKKNELKKILKPLIKECIKEVLLEEGVLSNVVSEVFVGMQLGSTLLQESKPPPLEKTNKFQSKAVENTRKKILEAVGKDSYNGVNLFEGTEALSNSGNSSSPSAALSGVSAADPGIDISSLPGASNWGKLI